MLLSTLSTKVQGYITVALLCVIGIGGLYIWYQSSQVEQLTKDNGSLQTALVTTTEAFAVEKQLSWENQKAQAKLRLQLAQANNVGKSRQQTIKDLKREINDVKKWANTLLPDAIRGLHQRPELNGSEQYREWLSSRNPLPASSKQPENERRPE